MRFWIYLFAGPLKKLWHAQSNLGFFRLPAFMKLYLYEIGSWSVWGMASGWEQQLHSPCAPLYRRGGGLEPCIVTWLWRIGLSTDTLIICLQPEFPKDYDFRMSWKRCYACIISFCLLNISDRGSTPHLLKISKKSAAPTGTFRKPKRCKWHHPWENPRLHQWQSSYMQVNGFTNWKSFWKTILLIPNPKLFSFLNDVVSKNLKSQLGAAGGDDQLFKPNGVENADLAPTRAFAKYQGSGDSFGGWCSNVSISHVFKRESRRKNYRLKSSADCLII